MSPVAALLPLAVLCAGMTPSVAAAQATSCADTVQWSGDVDTVERARSSLSTGTLADVPASACAGVELELAPADDRGVLVRLRRGPRELTHVVRDPAALPSWIESWLAPAVTATVVATADRVAVDTSRAEESRVEEVERPVPLAGPASGAVPADSLPIRTGLRFGLELDDVAPAWIDADLELSIGVARHVWIAVALGGAWAPEQDDEVRLALRVSGRVGWRASLGTGLLRLGLGIGIVSASARGERPDDTEVVDDEAGPLIEVVAGYDLPLYGDLGLTFAVIGRVHVPDDVFEGADPPQEMAQYEPVALPVVAIGFQAGLTFDLGGAW